MDKTEYSVLFTAVYANISNTANVAQKLRFKNGVVCYIDKNDTTIVCYCLDRFNTFGVRIDKDPIDKTDCNCAQYLEILEDLFKKETPKFVGFAFKCSE